VIRRACLAILAARLLAAAPVRAADQRVAWRGETGLDRPALA